MNNHKRPIWTKSFTGLAMINFFIFITFYGLLTTLPIYVIHELGGSEAQGGLVVTSMLIAAIIIRPFSGNLLEKIGKRKGLIWGAILFTSTIFLYFGIDAFIPLLMIRFIHGLSFGVLTTATSAIAADLVPSERRGEGLGYFAMSTNIAFVVGPFLGLTLIQQVSFQALLVVISTIMFGGILLAFFIQVPIIDHLKQDMRRKKLSIHDLFELKAIPIGIISGLVGIAYSSILSYVSVFAAEIGLAEMASYFFAIFAAVMIISRPSLGQLFDLKGPKYVIVPCLFIFSVGLIVLSYTNSTWIFLIAAALIGLGSGSLLPSFQTMCIQVADKHRSGHATSTFYVFWDTGIAFGSYTLGLIAAQYNFQVLYIVSAVLLLVVIGIFFIQQSWQGKMSLRSTRTETSMNEK